MINKKYIALLSLFLLFFACKQKKQAPYFNSSNSGSDSTAIWIKNGTDATLPIEVRKEFLQKAYKEIVGNSNDSLRLHYLSELSLVYLTLKDSVNFRKVNDKAILLSEEIKDSVARSGLYWDRCAYYNNYFIKDSAYYEYRQAE